MRTRLTGLLSSVVLVAACSQQETTSTSVECTSPRPEMCTREYRPVCGAIDTGIRCVTEPCPSVDHKTFGNACDACSNKQVMYYSEGECPSEDKGDER
ncbi:hypothetical protein [Litorivivens sp.]|uniref:hypothetical protein n=1 Tax=Litorivivens sp. TaxID=2020868 RepID=UPI003561AA61